MKLLIEIHRKIHTFCPGEPVCPVKPSSPGLPGSPGIPGAPGIPPIPRNMDETFPLTYVLFMYMHCIMYNLFTISLRNA